MDDAIKKLKELNARRIFVQIPEGLKAKAQDIAKELEKNGFDVTVCLEPTYGACDLRDVEAKVLGCDAILHIGHESLGIKTEVPVIFWEYFIDAKPTPILEKEISKLKDCKKIGLVTSIQFVRTIPAVKEFLEKNGKEVFVTKALQHQGQILGCNLHAAKAIENKVDCFLCITAGKFYGLGLALETEKPVWCLDLEKNELYSLAELKKKIQKTVVWNKSWLKDAKKVGILVSWKKGQMFGNLLKIKEWLKKEGKEVYTLAADEILPEKLAGLKLDCLVSLACPRIAVDDIEKYKIPIINASELDI
jgi:2-(3-amino-3-carboxypropyl)histidine synthase